MRENQIEGCWLLRKAVFVPLPNMQKVLFQTKQIFLLKLFSFWVSPPVGYTLRFFLLSYEECSQWLLCSSRIILPPTDSIFFFAFSETAGTLIIKLLSINPLPSSLLIPNLVRSNSASLSLF